MNDGDGSSQETMFKSRIAYNRRVSRKDISKVMKTVSKRWNYQIDGLNVEKATINFITMKEEDDGSGTGLIVT